MKNRIYASLFMAFFFFGTTVSYSQNGPKIPVFNADSLASGNYKDVLSSFFQLAFDNLTGKQKELKFTSNPYAIMLRADPDLAVDTNYGKSKYRLLRNLNFSFNAKMDSSYKFNGFSSGITYAIINRRDYTIYNEFRDLVLFKGKEYLTLSKGISATLRTLSGDPAFADLFQDQGDSILNNKTFTFDKLDPRVKDLILKIAKDSNLVALQKIITADKKVILAKNKQAMFDEVKKDFQNRLLWTIGLSDTTYNDKFMFSNVALTTRLLKGVSKPHRASNFELDIMGCLNFVDDTLKSGRDLKRSILTSEAGFNWVYKAKKTNQSILELKFSAAYNRIFNGAYKNEEKEVFTLNGTFRIRILDEVWLPLQFKYDPKSGNVLGFLSVKFNFTSLKKMVMPGK